MDNLKKRDENGFRMQQYERKQKYEPLEPTDINDLLEMSLESLQRTRKDGRPAVYEDSERGLLMFQERTEEYFEYIEKRNNAHADEKYPRIIPDIESWCTFLGISRKTVCVYEQQRGEEWQKYIGLVKNAIAGIKKQLASKGKMPVVYAIFDLCNNHSYSNTSEFKVETVPTQQKEILVMQKNDIEQIEQIEMSDMPLLPPMEQCL